MKTRSGVGDDGRPSPAEARRSWGEDSLLSPTWAVPELRLRRAVERGDAPHIGI